MRLVLAASLVAWLSAATAAEVIYGTTHPEQLRSGSAPVAGSLYRIEPETAAHAMVGAVRMDGREPIGVTGLAIHPASGVLYGITAANSPSHPNSLVTINIANGDATLVGSLGVAATDIAFDRAGTLFTWLRDTSQMATLDLATGKPRRLGRAGQPGEPGAVAIDRDDRIYVVGSGATGSLDLFDVESGTVAKGPPLKGMPFAAGVNSIAFSSSGMIYAVNTNLASTASTMLVKIDPRSGFVTKVGALPPDTDAIVLAEKPWSVNQALASRGTVSLLLAALCLVLAFGAIVVLRRRAG